MSERESTIVSWHVEIGPFDSYGKAYEVAVPIHAEREGEFGIAIVGRDAKGEPQKVVV